jgi:5'-methylthioadenosine phosphorylase
MAVKIGIIGGSGLDDPDIFKEAQALHAETAYGPPSSALTVGVLNGIPVVMIARHGRRHQYSPTEVNYRANIQALRDQRVTHILATTACGSLRTGIGRGDLVVLDQFIDFTKHRINTFHDSFQSGAFHTAMADPFDADLRTKLLETARSLGFSVHPKGTVITIEGPRFSTRAESNMFRDWGADVINMSIAPEAALANEAGIPYAAVAMATDYDCWKKDEAPVTWEEILEVFHRNADRVAQLIKEVVTKI